MQCPRGTPVGRNPTTLRRCRPGPGSDEERARVAASLHRRPRAGAGAARAQGFWGDSGEEAAVRLVPARGCPPPPQAAAARVPGLQEKGLRNASSFPTPCVAVFILKVTLTQHPYYGDISGIAAAGLPPALCCSGRGQQQEIKNCFYVASELCRLNEPTNPAVPACVLLALLSTRSIKLLTGCCL